MSNKKRQRYIDFDGKKFPIADIKDNGGLKRKIVELVLNAPTPDRECERIDFLMTLQAILDDYRDATLLRSKGKQNVVFHVEYEKEKDITEPLESAFFEFFQRMAYYRGASTQFDYGTLKSTKATLATIPIIESQPGNKEDPFEASNGVVIWWEQID